MKRKYEVFISSTTKDLDEERKYFRDYIIHSGHIPVGMEVFEGGARPAWQKIEEAIRACDYFVLIVGGRYGALKPDDPAGLSYTECEYRLARELGKEVMVFLQSDEGVATLPAEKRDDDAGATAKLEGFRACVRGGYVVTWDKVQDLRSSAAWRISLWMQERKPPKTSGWVKARSLYEAEERLREELASSCARLEEKLECARTELELERSRKEVYTYLFDRLNPYEDVPLTRQFLQDLHTHLDQMSKVIHALENLIGHYVQRVIPTACRVYFAYSLSRADLGREVTPDDAANPEQPRYALGISSSKEGKWNQGEIFVGPTNLHNVYTRRETLGVRDARVPRTDPNDFNQPVADEGSVIASPVLYGERRRISLGVVGVSSPEVGRALEYYPLVRELGILFSALFYAYGQHLRHNASRVRLARRDDKSVAIRLRNDIVDYYLATGGLKLD